MTYDSSSNLPSTQQKSVPYYKVDMRKIDNREVESIKQTQRGERAKLLDQVTSIETDIQGGDFQEVRQQDQISTLELNQNVYYRNYMQGMDSNHNSFYIESLKDELHKMKSYEQEEKIMKRVRSLND